MDKTTGDITRKKRIAVIVDSLSSDYVQGINEGIAEYCVKHDIEQTCFIIGEILGHQRGNYQNMSVAAHITPNNVDGVIFCSATQMTDASPEYLRSFIAYLSPLPVVNIGYPFSDVSSIVSDCSTAMKEVVEELIINQKRKRIALMGVANNSIEVAERTRIYKEVLKEHGLEYDESLTMYGAFTYSRASQVLKKYYDENGGLNFDAIVALNDDMAYAIIDFCKNHDIKVPEQIAVTGFDDIKRSAFFSPTLTTVNQNIEGQGYTACEALDNLLDKKKIDLLIKVPAKSKIRESSGHLFGELTPIKDKELIKSATEWSTITDQFVDMVHMYSDMQNDDNLIDFADSINSHFRSVDINAAAVVVFSKPIETDYFEYFTLPQSAMVLSAYDMESNIDIYTEGKFIQFNPSEKILPDGMIGSMHDTMVMALSRTTVLYGYIVFRPGKFNSIVYTMTCRMFMSALATSYKITLHEQQKQKLEHEYDLAQNNSITDEMTGLLNRRGFISLSKKSLEIAKGTQQTGIVFYCDMDGLKKINDHYGHAAGDIAIKAEATILHDQFRESDIIGRLGGDEFALTIQSMRESNVQKIREDIQRRCDKWNMESGKPYKLSISIGYAAFTKEKNNYEIDRLLEEADSSLYKEKEMKHSLRAD